MTLEPALADLFSLAKKRVESTLEGILPAVAKEPSRLHTAMRYAALGEGKRVRPLLVYATAQAVYSDHASADSAAAAVELIHAYSLVHDDLPAMDDDDLRRGKPSCHKAFDEATAILAGDALQTLAFAVLSDSDWHALPPKVRLDMLNVLANASGSVGLAGGQVLDLNMTSQDPTLETLATMHRCKTGALIEAAVLMGGLCATDDSATLACLKNYAQPLGLAFQVIDDVLDGTGDTVTLGKPAGADQERGQPTFLSILGEASARQYAEKLKDQAIDALDDLGVDAALLAGLAQFTVSRSH